MRVLCCLIVVCMHVCIKKKKTMTRNLGKTFIMIYKHSCESPMKGDTPLNIIFKCFGIRTGNIRCIDLYSTV